MADLIKIQCPQCKAIHSVAAEYLDKKVRCPQCREVFIATQTKVEYPAVVSTDKGSLEEFKKINRRIGFFIIVFWVVIALHVLSFFFNLANITAQQSQYEAMKKTAPLDEVLKKHLEIHKAKLNMIRDIPFIGSAAARASGENNHIERLERVIKLLREIDSYSEYMAINLRYEKYDIRRKQLENADAPASEILANDIEEARERRQDEIKKAEENVDKATEAVKLIEEEERSDAITH